MTRFPDAWRFRTASCACRLKSHISYLVIPISQRPVWLFHCRPSKKQIKLKTKKMMSCMLALLRRNGASRSLAARSLLGHSCIKPKCLSRIKKKTDKINTKKMMMSCMLAFLSRNGASRSLASRSFHFLRTHVWKPKRSLTVDQ